MRYVSSEAELRKARVSSREILVEVRHKIPVKVFLGVIDCGVLNTR